MKSKNFLEYKANRSLSFFILFIIINSYSCDIPVHCLKSQITGEWTFYLTKAFPQTKENLYKLGCSHTIPSNENNAYNAQIDQKYFVDRLTVKLNEDDSVELRPYQKTNDFLSDENSDGSLDIKLTGLWTMVYDEGFDVNVEEYSFFAFSKYSPNQNESKFFSGNKKNKWVSRCYSTLLGWYHKGESWGCFYGNKNNENSNLITNGEVDNKMIVIENTVKSKDNSVFDFMRFRETNPNKNKKSEVEIFEDLRNGIEKSELLSKINENENKDMQLERSLLNKTASLINSIQNLWVAEPYDEFTTMSIKELNKYAGRKKSLLEKPKKQIDNIISQNKEEEMLKGYHSIVENLRFQKGLKNKLNTINDLNNTKNNTKNVSKSTYKNLYNSNENDKSLTNFPIQIKSSKLKYKIKNFNIPKINIIKSIKKNINEKNNTSFFSIANSFKFKSISSTSKKYQKKKKNSYFSSIRAFDYDYPDLPREFNRWVSYMPEIRNQGKCGSCYAVSTLNMLESRLKIKHGISEELSLNHILNCSVYNQGCEGGYSYLVLKFAKELELIPKACENTEYKSDLYSEFQCGAKNCDNNEKVKFKSYKASDFGYLGGSYGKCNEELLMRELIKNGPVVVSFEPDYHFMMYRKGIYKSVQNNWIDKNLSKPEWEKVDHSVTLVGWGYDEIHKTKYWLLLNSWGKHWGENGYFRMIRGIDHLGIESICEIGNIYPIRD